MFQTNVSSVLSVFVHMLQMFHLDVSKVDQVLYDADGWQTAACRNHLSLLLGRSRGSTRGFALCGRGVGAGTRFLRWTWALVLGGMWT
jgi:hypothetical protein